uniref:Uncharacterized protein n=1 Tax=Arundo donax TaxID=35708 RepID=A0A0A9DX66_ARUDO
MLPVYPPIENTTAGAVCVLVHGGAAAGSAVARTVMSVTRPMHVSSPFRGYGRTLSVIWSPAGSTTTNADVLASMRMSPVKSQTSVRKSEKSHSGGRGCWSPERVGSLRSSCRCRAGCSCSFI